MNRYEQRKRRQRRELRDRQYVNIPNWLRIAYKPEHTMSRRTFGVPKEKRMVPVPLDSLVFFEGALEPRHFLDCGAACETPAEVIVRAAESCCLPGP